MNKNLKRENKVLWIREITRMRVFQSLAFVGISVNRFRVNGL